MTELKESLAVDVRVAADANALADEAAILFAQIAQQAIAARGKFTVALAGGSTPELLYQRLTEPAYRSSIDWSRVLVFFGDERFVPPDDERSNYRLAAENLLRHAPIPANNVFPVDTSLPTAEDAANAYAQTLETTLGEGPPILDLILLGLGDDGHTASLFPDKPSLSVTDKWAVASPPGILPPPVERVTLTLPVLNAARTVAFLVSGAKKAPVMRDILRGDFVPEERPAVGIAPVSGSLVWLLDAAASRML